MAAKVYIIDRDREMRTGGRGLALKNLAQMMKLEVDCVGSDHEVPWGDVCGVVGHHKDLEDVKWPDGGLSVPVIHYGGDSFRVERPGHYRFPWPLDRRASDVTRCETSLRNVFVWLRDKSAPPAFLLPSDDFLAPLLAFGVLLDGFVALLAEEEPPASDWFTPAIEAALSASPPRGNAVDSDNYWRELRGCTNAITRIGKMLADPATATPGFREIMDKAGELRLHPQTGNGGVGANKGAERSREEHGVIAAVVYTSACDAVEAAWNELSKGAPFGEAAKLRHLVAAASDGFHVLAAGHL